MVCRRVKQGDVGLSAALRSAPLGEGGVCLILSAIIEVGLPRTNVLSDSKINLGGIKNRIHAWANLQKQGSYQNVTCYK